MCRMRHRLEIFLCGSIESFRVLQGWEIGCIHVFSIENWVVRGEIILVWEEPRQKVLVWELGGEIIITQGRRSLWIEPRQQVHVLLFEYLEFGDYCLC